MDQGAQGVNIGRWPDEVAGVIHRANLVIHHSPVIEIAVELRCIESKDQPADGGARMAGETFAAARVMPDLGACGASVMNHECLVLAALGYQRSVGQ